MRNLVLITIILLNASCNESGNTKNGDFNGTGTDNFHEERDYGNIDLDSVASRLVESDTTFGNLKLKSPQSWTFLRIKKGAIGAKFPYMQDTGFFRVASFPDSLRPSDIHLSYLGKISKMPKSPDRDQVCFDSLVFNDNSWILSNQRILKSSQIERYLSSMYLVKDRSVWQFNLVLPEDGTNAELGKYILGQFILNAELNGSHFLKKNSDIIVNQTYCKDP